MILVAVDDLIFLSKIRETARLVGVPVEAVDPKKLPERPVGDRVRAVILDLNHGSGAALDALRTLKANRPTAHLPVVGFVSHVHGDLVAAARAAGCDEVLARSAFVAQLPELLKKLAGQNDTPPSGL